MIKTYFRLAYRSLAKNKLFSFINVFGLAIGLTCCLLISMYIYQEFSYDAHQQFGDRLYQLGSESKLEGKTSRYGRTSALMAPAMQQEFPEIESTTRLMNLFQDDKTLLQYQSGNEVKSFYEANGYIADSTFFKLLTFNFLEGSAATALNEPNSVVISKAIAHKIFGSKPALNKTLHINSNTNGAYDYKITGVFMPAKTPSHIDAEFILSMRGGEVGTWVSQMTDMINNNMFFSYLLLKPGTNPKKLEAKFDAFIKKHAGDELRSSGRSRRQYLTPVRDIHLYANDEGNVTPGGSLSYLYILLSIAIVTLLIACVNFMNLSTARSSKRALEIGVRKVMGAEKKALVKQFLCEAIMMSLVAFIIAVGFSFLLLPLFEDVSGKAFSFSFSQYGALLAAFLLVTIAAGLIAGLYPAFYLSAFKPVTVLKGKFSNSLAAISFRKALVVFQFVISVALIVASISINNQMKFLRNQDLGFVKDQQIIIPLRTTTAKNIYPSLKNALANSVNIDNVGASIYYPGISNSMDWLLYRQGSTAAQSKDVYINYVDDNYLQTLGIAPVAGRLFSKQFPADTSDGFILNQQAVKVFGFANADDAIGKKVVMEWGGTQNLFNVVGVVKDFHFKDLHSGIESYGFVLNSRPSYDYVIAHAQGNNIKEALSSISAAWSKLNPNEPLEYGFLDQDFEKNYAAEDRLAAIIRYFTVIAVFISCLGLFGLTTFTVEQRTKEMGIRKVLGASNAGIISLLSKDFLKLVLISFFIASPIAWYFINHWLESFAYRAPFTIWIVLSAWVTAFLIAFFTISIQAIKVALTNPVKNLRTE